MSGTRARPPRDVVFDLGGVLVDWDPRYLLCGDLGFSSADADRFLERICSREWHATIDGGRRFADAGDALAREHPEHAATIRAYTRDWEKMFAGEFRASARMLAALKEAGYRLHALSNYPGERISFLYRRFAFMREFETVVLSGLVGAQKPDEAIFRYLLARIGARECVFIDDRAENVAAARACGIRAVQFRPPPGNADLSAILDGAGLRDLLDGRLPTSNGLV